MRFKNYCRKLNKYNGQTTIKLTIFCITMLLIYAIATNYISKNNQISQSTEPEVVAKQNDESIPQPAALLEHTESIDRGNNTERTAFNPTLKIPVLMYHDVVDAGTEINSKGLLVTQSEFESQLTYFKNNGFNTINLEDLYQYIQNKHSLPDKPICITFDDGYASFYNKVFPILKKLQMRATVAVITGYAYETIPSNYLSWLQIKEMRDSGLVEIVSHTQTHQALGDISENTDWAKKELAGSNYDLVHYGGINTDKIVYPFGSYNAKVIEMEKEQKYKMGVTTKSGLVTLNSNIWALPRIRALHGDSGQTIMDRINYYVRYQK